MASEQMEYWIINRRSLSAVLEFDRAARWLFSFYVSVARKQRSGRVSNRDCMPEVFFVHCFEGGICNMCRFLGRKEGSGMS